LRQFFIEGYFANECHALIEESALRCIKNHSRSALSYFSIELFSFSFLACAVAFILFYYSVMDTTMLLERLYVCYDRFDIIKYSNMIPHASVGTRKVVVSIEDLNVYTLSYIRFTVGRI